MTLSKRIYSRALACLLALHTAAPSVCRAEETVSEVTTRTRTADFSIHFLDENAARAITLEATYSSDTKKYKVVPIAGGDRKDSFVLQTPLNFLYLRTLLSHTIYKALGVEGSDPKPLSQEDVVGIYSWLYAAQDPETAAPAAGKLFFGQYAMVLYNNKDSFNDEQKRHKAIKQHTDAVVKQQVLLAAKDQAIAEWVVERKSKLAATLLKKREEIASISKKPITNTYTKAKQDAEIAAAANDSITVHAAITALNRTRSSNGTLTSKGADATHLDAQYNAGGGTYFSFDNDLKKADWQQLVADYDTARRKLARTEQAMRDANIFKIKNITTKFERGFIEDVHIELETDDLTAPYFDNIVPIGSSSTTNWRNMDRMILPIRKSRASDSRFIFLSDAFQKYGIYQQLLTRDYAPADTVLQDISPASKLFVVLHRQQSIHLFDSRVYTDLVGLDENTPNGLVQLEVSRRFNFWTNRQQNWGLRGDRGWINYVYLHGTWSKIEDKLKGLPLRNAYVVENGAIVSPNYVTNLDLRRYESASLGVDVNVFLMNWKDGKLILFADAGLRYGHTPIIDSIRHLDANGELQYPLPGEQTDFHAHTMTVYPRVKLEFLAERRVGFTLSAQLNFTHLFSNEFKQVASDTKSDLTSNEVEKKARKSHQFDVETRILTGSSASNHMFVRGRFFFQQGDPNTFFPQIQVGYNYNLIFKQ